METSAKNSINVDESFITLARDIKKRLIDSPDSAAHGDTGSITSLNQPKQNAKTDKKCCS